MINNNRKPLRQTILRHALLATFVAVTSNTSWAQKASAVDSGLNAPVHLHLGSTTLARVASAMEEQTGVHVVVPPYLQERQLAFEIDGLSMKTALDALAELNDWQVTVFNDKAVQISRYPVPDVQSLGELPASLVQVLPDDFRRYLRIPPVHPQGKQIKISTPANAAAEKQTDKEANPFAVRVKLNSAVIQQKQSLWEFFQQQGASVKAIAYVQLPPLQRRELVSSVVFQGFADIFGASTRGANLWYGTIYPYQQDETKANITVQNSEIRVSTITVDGKNYIYQAFGEPIHSPTKVPDPLHLNSH